MWAEKCSQIVLHVDFDFIVIKGNKAFCFIMVDSLCLIVSQSISSVTQSCPTLCDPMNCSTPGLPDHHQLPEFTQSHAHQVSDAIQPSHPLSSPSPPAVNPSHHQGLFQWVNSSHEVGKVLEFQPQHQSLQWTPYKEWKEATSSVAVTLPSKASVDSRWR